MKYFAYGMNTNISNMATRCPNAQLLGKATLYDYELRFRGHADIEQCPESSMEGVLWEITEECLQNLDALEGYPDYYTSIVVDVEYENETHGALVYIMNDQSYESSPAESYYNHCMEGYKENGLDPVQLSKARELTKMHECNN
jgi:gamma-glutamylcyclotransferase (GGCT)/AIG2-like uncharacterized protein YtfP